MMCKLDALTGMSAAFVGHLCASCSVHCAGGSIVSIALVGCDRALKSGGSTSDLPASSDRACPREHVHSTEVVGYGPLNP